jgi:hypothetical protein
VLYPAELRARVKNDTLVYLVSKPVPMAEPASVYEIHLTIVVMIDHGAADPVQCRQM